MLIISGRQFTRTNWPYFWLAVVALVLGIAPPVLLTMVITVKSPIKLETILPTRSKSDFQMWNYIAAHWQGRFGLAKSFLLNGVLILVLFFAVAAALSFTGFRDSQPAIYTWAVLLLVWAIWACVGAFRSGLRNALDRTNGKFRRVGGVLVMGIVLLFAWGAGRDLYHLLVYPLFLHL